ncbi:60Kd inner membrane protein-domain-containing protein [Sparassis latifolia]
MQRARLSVRTEACRLPRSSRNFWWTASKTPTVQEQAPTQEILSVPEQPPADAESFIEGSPASETIPLSPAEPGVDFSAGTDIPIAPLDGVIPDASAITSIAPLQYGDLAALGLVGWSPAGLCRWGMELLQVSTGLPWFWTIVGVTIVSRAVLFPFTVLSIQNTAKLAPYQGEMLKLREKMTEAQNSRDMLLLQNVAMKQQMIYKKCGVSMGQMALLPFVQLPVTLGMFFGVKKLCDLPLEQLKISGLDILPNLTVADPTYMLPVAAAVLMNLQLRVSMADMAAAPHTAHLINLFRVLSMVGVFFMVNLPSGVMVYLITSLSFILAQTLFMRIPVVRRALGIPIVPRHMQSQSATFKESLDFVKQWWKDKKAEQEAAIRANRRNGRR